MRLLRLFPFVYRFRNRDSREFQKKRGISITLDAKVAGISVRHQSLLLRPLVLLIMHST